MRRHRGTRRGQKVKPTKPLFLSFSRREGNRGEREREQRGERVFNNCRCRRRCPLELIYSNTDTRGKDNGEKKEWEWAGRRAGRQRRGSVGFKIISEKLCGVTQDAASVRPSVRPYASVALSVRSVVFLTEGIRNESLPRRGRGATRPLYRHRSHSVRPSVRPSASASDGKMYLTKISRPRRAAGRRATPSSPENAAISEHEISLWRNRKRNLGHTGGRARAAGRRRRRRLVKERHACH